MSYNLTKAIIGIFVGTIWGLFMTLTYWGHAIYQIILSIISGSLLGYFAVAPRQAWQQVKIAVKQVIVSWPKAIIDKFIKSFQEAGYLDKRLDFIWMVVFFVLIFLFFKLRLQFNISAFVLYAVMPFLFLMISFFIAGVFNNIILPASFFLSVNDPLFYKLWQPYIIKDYEEISLSLKSHKEDDYLYLHTGPHIILFTKAPWYKYEWLFFLTLWLGLFNTVFWLIKLFLTAIAWIFLSVVVVIIMPFRFLFWLLAAFSTQDIFLKIFTGTAFSVMAGVHYHSYGVGLATAGLFSLVLAIFKHLARQPFNLFAFLGKEPRLRLSFIRVNLFKTRKS